jgi:hypothetical protein
MLPLGMFALPCQCVRRTNEDLCGQRDEAAFYACASFVVSVSARQPAAGVTLAPAHPSIHRPYNQGFPGSETPVPVVMSER